MLHFSLNQFLSTYKKELVIFILNWLNFNNFVIVLDFNWLSFIKSFHIMLFSLLFQ